MMRSLFSGVSGLKNHQTRMDTIGNNISNVNTTGFKSSRTNFVDTLSQTLSGASSPTENLGGTNAKQIGLGSSVSSVDLLFTDGSVQSTGKNTDLCLSGNGLFVVHQGNSEYYTRNGDFEFDADGNYVLAGTGYKVQGWMGTDGNINTQATPTGITIPSGKSMASQETENATYSLNLNASTPTITKITTTDKDGNSTSITSDDPTKIDGTTIVSATLTLSDGTTQTVTSGTYTVGHSIPLATTLTVYDSLGASHTIPINIEKTAANKWQASLGTITDSSINTTGTTMEAIAIEFSDSGAFQKGTGQLALKYNNGAKDCTVAISFEDVTQYSGSSTINASADGHAAGTLESVSVDKSGVITGTYSNGVIQAEAQVAIAQFNNSAGLTKTGTSLYQKSNNSGEANIKTASDLGCTITPSALEMSNVDVANEFSDMIVTQRGFQSNSKIITVSDEMLETLINMKR